MANSAGYIVTTEESRDRHTPDPSAVVTSLLPSQRSSLYRHVNRSRFIVLMGVSGTGKSTLGRALSDALHLPFIDGDDLHPAANVAKMSRGVPLDDADRRPWLETIRNTAVAQVLEQVGVGEPAGKPLTDDRPGAIVACSALKRAYRAVLRGATSDAVSLPTRFVYLKGDRAVLAARMLGRAGHFMKAGMLESQLDTLESPEGEPDVVTVSVDMSTEEQVQRVVEAFRSWS